MEVLEYPAWHPTDRMKGLELERLGCLFAPLLNGPKARIKLMLALAAGYTPDKLKEIFPI